MKLSEPFKPGFGLTNKYLEEFLTQYCDNFHGVYCSDELEKKVPKVGYYVINLAPRFSSSGHFVAVIVQDDEILYFDSFGFRPMFSSVWEFLNKVSKGKN